MEHKQEKQGNRVHEVGKKIWAEVGRWQQEMERDEIQKKQSKLVQLFQYENLKFFKKLQKVIGKNMFFLVVVGCSVVFFVLFFTETTESASWVGHSQEVKSVKQNISTDVLKLQEHLSYVSSSARD